MSTSHFPSDAGRALAGFGTRALPLLVLLAPAASGQPAPPPSLPPGPHVDTLFGAAVADPYRRLEDPDDPEVQAWFRAQDRAARAALGALPGRDALLARLRAIDAASPDDVSLPREAGGRSFYTRERAGEPTPRLYVRDGWTGEERLLVDPAAFAGAGEAGATTLSDFEPTPDGRLVAFGIAAGGSENAVLYVVDAETGQDLGLALARNGGGHFTWLPDGRSLLYLQLQELPPDAPPTDRFRNIQIRLHRMEGGAAAEDPVVFSAERVGLDPALVPWMLVDAAQGLVIGALDSGAEDYDAYFVASAASVAAGTPDWRPLLSLDDEVQWVAVHGGDLYTLTWKDTPNGRIVRTPLDAPDLASAEVVVPEGAGPIQSMAAALDGLYVRVFEEGRTRLVRVPWGGAPEAIPLPLEASVSELSADPLQPGVRFWLNSWTQTGQAFEYTPSAGRVEPLPLRPVGPYDRFDGAVAETVLVPGHDGVQVPLTIVRPDGLTRDGSHPVLMFGYGAYGSTDEPSFTAFEQPWHDVGGVIAQCHVRGGGYYGEAWHRAGQKATKPNTWKDAIACAEYLVREGYTRPERLAIWGWSAGGILVGRALTERPDLFGAAVGLVGMADLLRYETTANGALNVPEYGSVQTEEGFRGLLEMSPYHHVRPSTPYPAVLLTTGMNDPRVDPWQAGKMAAALQAATTGGAPVWLRVDYEGGHGSATQATFETFLADAFAFLMAQAGLPAYQPPAGPDR